MEQVTSYSATSSSKKGIDRLRIVLATAGIILTFLVLYAGFVFLRDSGAPRLVIAIVAVIWGVGGMGLLFTVAHYTVESFSTKWTARLQPYVFIGPAIVLLAWYLAAPSVRTFMLSFADKDGVPLEASKLFQNYQEIFSERGLSEALRNNFLWLIVGTPLTVGLGLVIAVLADRSRFEKAAKSLIFLPMAISMVGAGVIWRYVFDVNPNIGIINAAVQSSGGTTQDWLRMVQPVNNLFLIMVMIWLQTGFGMVLISAAIKGLSADLLEAARVDGASEFRIFFRIIIPNISGTLLTVTTTVIIFTLKIFDIVMIMTGGNFGTDVIGVKFYRTLFVAGDSGVGSAIAVILLILVIPVMVYNLWEFGKRQAF